MARRVCFSVVALVLVTVVVLWARSDLGKGRGAVSEARRGDPAQSVVAAVGSMNDDRGSSVPVGLLQEGVVVYQQSDYRQELNVTDFQYVEVTDFLYDSSSGQWPEVHSFGSASYMLLHIESAGPDVFVCGGFAVSGEVVFEKWKLNRPGMPQLVPSLYGQPAQPPLGVGFRKIEVYRGPLGDRLYGIDLDKERRYLVALVADSALGTTILYQVPLEVSAVPSVVETETTLPELSDMRFVSLMHHSQLGRVCYLKAALDQDLRVLLVDSDNDGVFDGAPIVGTRSFLTQLGLTTYDDWDSFMSP